MLGEMMKVLINVGHQMKEALKKRKLMSEFKVSIIAQRSFLCL